jgi:hypothetical protein
MCQTLASMVRAHFPEVKIFSVNAVEVHFATRTLLDHLLQGSDRLVLAISTEKTRFGSSLRTQQLRLSISENYVRRYHRSRMIDTKERMCNNADRLRSV